MKIKIKHRLIALFVVISVCARYYYLVDLEGSFLGFSSSQIAAVFIALVWGLVIWFVLIRKSAIRFPYAVPMAFFPLLALLSAFQAYRLYGQDIFSGFFAQYFPVAWALLYYPISKYVYYGKITIEDIKKLIKVVGSVQLVIFISQYILADMIRFTYVHEFVRYGQVKFYFSPVLLDLLLLFELDNFMGNGNRMSLWGKLISLGYMVAILFEVMVVIKFRLTTAGLLLCLCVGVLLGRNSIKKKTLYIFLGIIGGLLLLNTTIVQDILSELIKGKTYDGDISTMLIRNGGRASCFDMFLKHPFLGGGYPLNFHVPDKLISRDVSLGDLGIFGFLYIYGGAGILWVLLMWRKMLKYGWLIYKKKGQLAYMLYPLFFLITGINEFHWYEDWGFMVLVLFVLMQQNEFKDCVKITNTDCGKKRRTEIYPLYRLSPKE